MHLIQLQPYCLNRLLLSWIASNNQHESLHPPKYIVYYLNRTHFSICNLFVRDMHGDVILRQLLRKTQ